MQLWPRVPVNVKGLAHIRIICVRADIQRIGLATKLLECSMNISKENGCEGVFAKAVAKKSQLVWISYEEKVVIFSYSKNKALSHCSRSNTTNGRMTMANQFLSAKMAVNGRFSFIKRYDNGLTKLI